MFKRKKTYTILSPCRSKTLGTGISAPFAVEAILSWDLGDYGIRERSKGGYEMWIGRVGGGPKSWRRTGIRSDHTDIGAAHEEIGDQVLAKDWGPRKPQAVLERSRPIGLAALLEPFEPNGK